MAWDFGIDTFHTERTVNRESGDAIDRVVNGDIDWVRLSPLDPDPLPHLFVSHQANLHVPE